MPLDPAPVDACTIAFTRGIPPETLIPAEELSSLAHCILNAEPAWLFQYAPLGGYHGDPGLIEALSHLHGATQDEVFVGNGSLQIIDLLTRALFLPDAPKVILESPSYDRSIGMLRRLGAQLCPVPVGPDGPDPDQIGSYLKDGDVSFIYLIPDFQNPSGATINRANRSAIVELAQKANVPIIEDSPYRDLRFVGDDVPTFRALSGGRNVFSVSSLSKTLSPGLRIGYAIGPARGIDMLCSLAENTYLSPPPLTQAIAAQALDQGLDKRASARAVDKLRPRWRNAVTTLEDLFPGRMLSSPEGGYFVSLWLPTEMSNEAFSQAAADRGLVLSNGESFLPNPAAHEEIFLRLPFHALSPEQFNEGVARLVDVLKH